MGWAMRGLVNSWNKNWPELWCSLNGGMPQFVFARQPAPIGNAVPVFHFHIVNPRLFGADLRFLLRNDYATAFADELLDHMLGRRKLAANSIVLTFDDGPVNLYRYAYPLLRRYRCRAVAFISPGLHRDESALMREDRLCTWREIQEMHDSGLVDFQSHTFEHRFAPRWPQPWPLTGIDDTVAQQRRGSAMSLAEDFTLSRQTIEQRLRKHVEHLAFPNYRSTAAASAVARNVGYRGLWYGTLPHRPCNRTGDSPCFISRISGEFIRRLPGTGRRRLTEILSDRYNANVRRWVRSASKTQLASSLASGAEFSV